jgi:hypothetical protein
MLSLRLMGTLETEGLKQLFERTRAVAHAGCEGAGGLTGEAAVEVGGFGTRAAGVVTAHIMIIKSIAQKRIDEKQGRFIRIVNTSITSRDKRPHPSLPSHMPPNILMDRWQSRYLLLRLISIHQNPILLE